MKAFFDTSVIVAALVEPHQAHGRSVGWLKKARAGEFEWAIAAHSLAEAYAVLTTLPLKPRISPSIALRLLSENVLGSAEVVSLSSAEYQTAVKKVSEEGLMGGVVYDALIAAAAKKSGADKLFTLDPDDFKRVMAGGEPTIAVP